MEARTSARSDQAFLAFAAVFFVFHQFPSVLFTDRVEAAVDVLTPFAVVASTVAVMLALGAPRGPVLVAVLAAVLYVHGHGVHLAANSIHNEGLETDVVYFWDERFSHTEAVLGWFGLVAAFCLAERASSRGSKPTSPALLALAALLLGWTFFTSTVEGQTWWLELPAAALFGVWALRAPRPLLRAAAGAFAVGAVLIAVWAVWHSGVPEFSDL
ncbi:MAG: hypothetical protein ACR2ML_14385 [Solirubrobacteraceae bacterium]